MEREACVCDHGFERSDLCAEIIIHAAIIFLEIQCCYLFLNKNVVYFYFGRNLPTH